MERGSIEEREYLVDMWTEILFGDKNAGDYNGPFSGLLSCGYDPVGEAYILVAPNETWIGQITGRAYEEDNLVMTWDFVMSNAQPPEQDDRAFYMNIPPSYNRLDNPGLTAPPGPA